MIDLDESTAEHTFSKGAEAIKEALTEPWSAGKSVGVSLCFRFAH